MNLSELVKFDENNQKVVEAIVNHPQVIPSSFLVYGPKGGINMYKPSIHVGGIT